MKFQLNEIVIYARYPEVSGGDYLTPELLNSVHEGDEVLVVGHDCGHPLSPHHIYPYLIETRSGAIWSARENQLRKRRQPGIPKEITTIFEVKQPNPDLIAA